MPLPKPTLDNRGYDQLVAEGRNRIPRLAAQWSDHNASDPGITLLELAAWLTEQNIFRFDRLSDEAIRRFARLAGVEPLPPQVASTVVTIGNANAALIKLPGRMQLHGATGAWFETTQTLDVFPSQLVSVGCADRYGRFKETTRANAALEAYFPLSQRPHRQAGHAFYLGFDQSLDQAGSRLSLHVWTDCWQNDAATRDALIAEQAARQARLESECPGLKASDDWHRHYRARTVWEYHAGGGLWLPLQHTVDETRALSLSGYVHFDAPANHQSGGLSDLPALFFLRCRLTGGGYECPPRLLHVAINAVTAEHALSRGERELGLSPGHAGARFGFDEAPIVADSVQLRLDDGAGSVQTDWSTRLDWDESGAHDRHALLLPEDGALISGNGLRGQTLPAGYKVFARFRIGSGPAGNVAAHSLLALPASAENLALQPALAGLGNALTVDQAFCATGGAPRETLNGLRTRAYDRYHDVDKAVTLSDFERLARATPGVPIARAYAIAGFLPQQPCLPAPGVVTLVVVPSCRLPAPMPSQALLDQVRAYLEPRRLITSEVLVTAPEYRRVAVQARLHLDIHADPVQLLAQAERAVDAFFDPLSGGPDGNGWPAGRTVYRNEVLALLSALPGVLRVTDFGLLTGVPCSPPQSGACGCGTESTVDSARCDNIELCPHELVRPGRHHLSIQTLLPIDLQRSIRHDCEPHR